MAEAQSLNLEAGKNGRSLGANEDTYVQVSISSQLNFNL
jgi:hypothetical protein